MTRELVFSRIFGFATSDLFYFLKIIQKMLLNAENLRNNTKKVEKSNIGARFKPNRGGTARTKFRPDLELDQT